MRRTLWRLFTCEIGACAVQGRRDSICSCVKVGITIPISENTCKDEKMLWTESMLGLLSPSSNIYRAPAMRQPSGVPATWWILNKLY